MWSAPAQPVQLAAAWAFGEPEEVRLRVRASADFHGRIATAVSEVLSAAGVEHPQPQGAFYLFAEFEPHRQLLLERWGIETGPQLAAVLLREFGIATLPASAFGLGAEVLALRLATSLLAGDNDAQRSEALYSEHPQSLPWVAARLQTLSLALDSLLR